MSYQTNQKMEKIAIYDSGKVVLGWAQDAVINVDFVNQTTTQSNTYTIPLVNENSGDYLIVDSDYAVWNQTTLMDEDKEAMENDTDELCDYAFVAVVNLIDRTYFNVNEVCWKPIIAQS